MPKTILFGNRKTEHTALNLKRAFTTSQLSFELLERQTNPRIDNRNAPAVSFCEGFDFFNSAVVLVSPWPNNGQVVFEHGACYVISQPVSD